MEELKVYGSKHIELMRKYIRGQALLSDKDCFALEPQ